MTRNWLSPRLQRHRLYQYLLVIELVLTIVGLAISIAAALGFL